MVYVDNARAIGIVNNSHAEWCRLTADTTVELHELAVRAGIRFRFFCPITTLPTYRIGSIDLVIERDCYLVTLANAARLANQFGVKAIKSGFEPWRVSQTEKLERV